MIVPQLKPSPRQGYARGAQGVAQILRKSEQILIDEGFAALTLRRIAAECGIAQGNLSYYFKSKNDLVLALIDAIIESYRAALEQIDLDPGQEPARQLRQLAAIYLDDVASQRTTRIFTELWAISSRDALVREKLRGIYDVATDLFAAVVRRLNPGLDREAGQQVALAIVSILEGQTVFIGYEMPYADQRAPLAKIARDAIVELAMRAAR